MAPNGDLRPTPSACCGPGGPRGSIFEAGSPDTAVLQLPDLDQAKSAFLNGLSSTDTRQGYRHAIDEFIETSS